MTREVRGRTRPAPCRQSQTATDCARRARVGRTISRGSIESVYEFSNGTRYFLPFCLCPVSATRFSCRSAILVRGSALPPVRFTLWGPVKGKAQTVFARRSARSGRSYLPVAMYLDSRHVLLRIGYWYHIRRTSLKVAANSVSDEGRGYMNINISKVQALESQIMKQ